MTAIATTCPECSTSAEFDIPETCTDASVIFEPPCGHRSRIPNPHAPAVADEGATADGTDQVAVTDTGSGADTTA